MADAASLRGAMPRCVVVGAVVHERGAKSAWRLGGETNAGVVKRKWTKIRHSWTRRWAGTELCFATRGRRAGVRVIYAGTREGEGTSRKRVRVRV